MAERVLDQFTTPEFNISYEESVWQAQSIGESAHSASRRLQVAGDDVPKFIQELLGWTQVDFGGFKLERHPPDKHPRYPWLFARSAQFVRETGEHTVRGTGSTLIYDIEEWEFVYQADEDKLVRWLADWQRPAGVDPANETFRYVSRKVEQSISVQTLPMGALAYNEPNDKGVREAVPDGATGQLVPSRSRWWTWYQIPVTMGPLGIQLPGVLQENIDSCVGRMNSVEFEGVPPENLVLLDPKYVLKPMSNGEPAVDITFNAIERGGPDVSALALYEARTETGSFTRLLRADGKYGRVFRKDDPDRIRSIYEPADFNKLFKLI